MQKVVDVYDCRYMSIVRPRSPHLSLKSTTSSLAIIWMVSILVAIPTLLFSTTISYGDNLEHPRTACLMIWPDGNPSESLLDHIYQIIFFLVTYVLPMVGLSITYGHLGTVLWRDSNDSNSTKTKRSQNDKRKVKLKIMMI
jgi:tachykinin receptor 3